MRKSEFKVVPVPAACDPESRRSRGDAFALTLENTLNTLAVEGWDFVRAETVIMRRGGLLRGGIASERQVLVFRRDRPVLAQRPAAPGPSVEDLIAEAKARKPAAVPADCVDAAQAALDAQARAPRRARPVVPATAA